MYYVQIDTAGEIRRALQTLSVALVVDDDSSTVRPHLHAPPTPAATSDDHQTVAEMKQHPSLKQVEELRLGCEECDSIKDIGCQHLLLSHYRNQLLHWFVPESMLALSLSLNGNHYANVGKLALSLSFFISFFELQLILNFSLLIALQKFKALHIALSCELVLPLKHPDKVSNEILLGKFFINFSQGCSLIPYRKFGGLIRKHAATAKFNVETNPPNLFPTKFSGYTVATFTSVLVSTITNI